MKSGISTTVLFLSALAVCASQSSEMRGDIDTRVLQDATKSPKAPKATKDPAPTKSPKAPKAL